MPGLCGRCNKTVYFNEEKMAIGKSFHLKCFVCTNQSCNRRLDSSNLTEHDGNIYCKSCYAKLFGPKGYGYGVGTGVLGTDINENCDKTQTSIPYSVQAFIAPKMKTLVDTSNGTSNNNKVKVKFGTSDVCARCNKAVYYAEKMIGGGSVWHKSTCFNCKECHKRLESSNLCEKDKEIYCKSCYGRNWGPKGYGFGIGAGALQTTV